MEDVLAYDVLQEKLGDAYDLTSVFDCRKMISILLKANSDKEELCRHTMNKLRGFAVMVMDANTGKSKDAFLYNTAMDILDGENTRKNNLAEMVKYGIESKELEDSKLVDLVVENIWGLFGLSTRESALLGEMIERFGAKIKKENKMQDSENEKNKMEKIAEFCHESNRAYCKAIGDPIRSPWGELTDRERQSIMSGVKFRIEHPEANLDAQHIEWSKSMTEQGWVYGEKKDVEKKEHPCLVDWNELPATQKSKDFLFKNNVDLFR